MAKVVRLPSSRQLATVASARRKLMARERPRNEVAYWLGFVGRCIGKSKITTGVEASKVITAVDRHRNHKTGPILIKRLWTVAGKAKLSRDDLYDRVEGISGKRSIRKLGDDLAGKLIRQIEKDYPSVFRGRRGRMA